MTISDIAKLAGVSIATVSRVINNDERVKLETREKVAKIIEENHFVANSSAQSLANKKSFLIGILVGDFLNIQFLETAEVIVHFFESIGYACILSEAGFGGKNHEAALDSLAQRRPDGLILIGSIFENENVERAIINHYEKIPILIVGGKINMPNVISAYSNEKQSTMDVVNMMIEKGISNYIVVKGGRSTGSQHKMDGYIEACKENGVLDQARLWSVMSYSYDEVKKSIRNMLKAYPDIEGILFSNDYLANAGGRAIEELGYRVPERISYVSLSNSRYCYMSTPTITAVDWKLQELAEVGCNYMVEAFNGKGMPYVQVEMPASIIFRDSFKCEKKPEETEDA